MSARDELRDAVARALYGREIVPGAWLAADADTRVMYRRLADAALREAIPRIEAETREACAKVAENCSFGVDIGEWLVMTKKDLSARACREVAAAIRNQEPSK